MDVVGIELLLGIPFLAREGSDVHLNAVRMKSEVVYSLGTVVSRTLLRLKVRRL